MPSQPRTVLERISDEYYQLTASERKVADYVVVHQRDTQFMSISDLADACGVAEATVSRFCRRLKYKGYNAFKLAVANTAAQHPGNLVLSGEINPEDNLPDLCQKLYATAADALAQTLAVIRPESISAAADILTHAGRVLCMGQGGSMIMAMETAHLFSTAMPGFVPVWDSHLQMIAAATLTPQDAVLFFSYSGATRDLLELLEVVRERHAKVILITHFPKSPAAALVDVILQCGANEGPLQMGSVPARIAQLFLVDILFTEVCRRNEGAVKAVRAQVADVLSSKHL